MTYYAIQHKTTGRMFPGGHHWDPLASEEMNILLFKTEHQAKAFLEKIIVKDGYSADDFEIVKATVCTP